MTIQHPHYAGFGMRMLASVVDTLLSAVFLTPFFHITEPFLGFRVIRPTDMASFDPAHVTYYDIAVTFLKNSPLFMFESMVMFIVVITFWLCRSATPGKMLFRMTIADAKTLQKPTTRQFIIRSLGYIPSTLVFGIGFMWIYFDKKKHQGWHDKMAGTVVFYREKKQTAKAS